jgi:hypothetical protein
VEQPHLRQLALPVLLTALMLGFSSAAYTGWIRGTDHRDFYPRWAGARLALFEGRNLYSVETTREMQLMLYGREIPPDRDQQGFAYPATLVPLLLPFWFIDDVEVATALWEGVSVVLMLLALLFARRVWGSLPNWGVALLLVWYYPILMVFQAQITALPLASVSLALWAYTTRRDTLAGVAIAAGLGVKPELIVLPALVLLAAALREQRWRLVSCTVITGGLVFVASLLVAGWWIPDWLDGVRRYAAYAQTSWALGTAWTLSPLLALALVGGGVLALRYTRWSVTAAVAAAVPLGMLLIPQTLIWGLTMLLLPMALSWRAAGRWGVLALWLLGWVLIAGTGIEGWWRIQNLLLPALALALVAAASRQVVTPPLPHPDQKRYTAGNTVRGAGATPEKQPIS